MEILKNLQPQAVWNYFEEICQVPRPSKKEEKIIAYLLEFGKKNGLNTKRDEIGNVLISKPATKGKEKLKTVVFQSHVDMVCEKNADVEHDFDKDPIQPYIEDGWVKAKGTTLGADDGIGVAAQLAMLTSKDLEHGPIECLFTVDEETGLSGAFALQANFITGKILINLDSEDEGEIFIGCAGGKDTVAEMTLKKKKADKKSMFYKISVSGLKGGHSGDDINKGLGNSVKILSRLLWNADKKMKLSLVKFEGGNLRNAIPREAEAIVCIPPKKQAKFEKLVKNYIAEAKKAYASIESGLEIKLQTTEAVAKVMKRSTQKRLLNTLYACPHGVYAMSQKMPGMVETSTNLAAVKHIAEDKIEITTSQRSDSEWGKEEIVNTVGNIFRLAGIKFEHNSGYPGWSPNPQSEILAIANAAYKKLFDNAAVVRSIHAGLECGLFLEKYPDLDMISIGPTLRNVHSPDEKIEIETVEKFWKFVVEILQNIPEA
ncbi:MAG: cytosol nonspecific dipeptidase [Bacteroidia bacterium]|nr:MAG: cytosol nonspecific dipeptidase [Bacteroidia bacterium]